jgi:hypothetical protein
MAAHVIQIFATTNNPNPLSISQDNGATWVDTDIDDQNFNTTVAVGDTVQFAFSLSKNGVANNISSIQNITPATFYEAGKNPRSNNSWTGTIKDGNGSTPEEYQIIYQVSGVNGNQTQDPKLTMSSSTR